MPIVLDEFIPLLFPAATGILSALLALSLSQVKPLERLNRALPLCVFFGVPAALLSSMRWAPALTGALALLFGAAVWLLFRPSALYAAVAAALAALLFGLLELLRSAVGPWVIPAALVLAAVCCWQKVAILPDTPEVLTVTDRGQARKFHMSTATVLAVLLLPMCWVWYLLPALERFPPSERGPVVWFTAAIVLAILFVLRQLAFDAVQRIEAIIDKQYQAELLNLMQVIRSQRHDFNFHIQAISGMIEQDKYAECADSVRTMAKITNTMNDMLPLHDPAVSAMLNSFREMAAQKGIELQMAISDDLDHVPCSVYELNTVIGNLIQNAIDELDRDKSLSPWISVLILKRGGNHIIKVTNPCGQDAEAFRNCFQPGYTTKQSHEGIGLATVMRIVTKYHGAVFPEFDAGIVSFIIQLPGFFE